MIYRPDNSNRVINIEHLNMCMTFQCSCQNRFVDDLIQRWWLYAYTYRLLWPLCTIVHNTYQVMWNPQVLCNIIHLSPVVMQTRNRFLTGFVIASSIVEKILVSLLSCHFGGEYTMCYTKFGIQRYPVF